jgi:benzoate/toluate 1,2-dioxygenase beta subunit
VARHAVGHDELLARCARFVYDEAELLDSGSLDTWLQLFEEPAVYWLPIDVSKLNPLDALNLIYDDRPRLEDRIARLHTGFAFSEVPGSRTSHMIANLRLLSPDEYQKTVHDDGLLDGQVALAGRATVAHLRHGACEVLYARMAWALRPAGDTLKIGMKRVDLINAGDPLPLLTFLL